MTLFNMMFLSPLSKVTISKGPFFIHFIPTLSPRFSLLLHKENRTHEVYIHLPHRRNHHCILLPDSAVVS